MKSSTLALIVLALVSASAAGQTVRIVPLTANHLVYDSVRDKLYASIPGVAGANGNSVAVIDAATGVVETYVWVGSEPNRMAISDDGQFLYVGLDGAYSVRRLDLATLTPGLQFEVGIGTGGLCRAEDLAVVPGSPTAVAVARRDCDSSQNDGVALFVDGVPRPNSTPGSYGSRALAFSSSPGRLYGYSSSGYELSRMNVGANGIVEADRTRGMTPWYTYRFRYAQGFLFGTDGSVVDPEALEPVAILPAFSTTEPLTDVAVDSTAGRAYAIVGSYSPQVLRAYDLTTWRPTWMAALAGTQGVWSNLVTAGSNRLAFRTGSAQVVLVDLTNARPLTVAKRGIGNGVVSSTPTGLSCGVECAVLFPSDSAVTLSVTPSAGSMFVRWDGDADCADGLVTMSAARSCTAVFAQTNVGPAIEVPLILNDLVYSPATGMVYAAISSKDPVLGNTITEVDPATGALGASVWMGSEPNTLALAADGRTLHAALDGAAVVRRLDLTTLTPGDPFHLGRDSYYGPWSAMSIAVSPGDPDSVAVAWRGWRYSDELGVAVFDSGMRRPAAVSDWGLEARELLFGASDSRLYGGGSTYGNLVRFNVDTVGVTLADESSIMTGTGIRYENGRIYGSTGRAIDPEALSVVGTFPLTAGSGAAVCPDTAHGVVYFLERPSSTELYLRIYDADRFTRRQSIPIPGVSGAISSFVAAGPGRFAFVTDTGRALLMTHVGAVAARPSRDFDGDVQADVAVYRPASGTWFTLNSSADNTSYGARGWGTEAEGDQAVLGDFDGDGIVDPAVFRPATGTWFILESYADYTTWRHFGWGAPTDAPMPGDYDGDGTADAAAYRPATGQWFVRPSSGATPWTVVFGQVDDVPLTGDFDGDGIADIAVYRPASGTWLWLRSSSGFTEYDSYGWGVQAEGDEPVVGDFDGDGKTDVCVFRPGTGTWFVLESHAAYTTWSWTGWGQSGDTPTPADYDGDGITDFAVYRPATGRWYVRPSSGLAPWNIVFGEAGDVPLLRIQ